MEADFPGPCCKEIGLTTEHLSDVTHIAPFTGSITNGLILELLSCCTLTKLIQILGLLNPELTAVHPNTLKSRVNRVLDVKKRLVSKKKVKGVKCVDDFKQQVFHFCGKSTTEIKNSCSKENQSDTFTHQSEACKKLVITSPTRLPSESLQTINKDSVILSPRPCDLELEKDVSSEKEIHISEQVVSEDTKSVPTSVNNEERKILNFQEYQLAKGNKAVRRLQKKIKTAKSKLESLNKKTGHYSVRNVNKREERARKTLKELRQTQRQLVQVRTESENNKVIIKSLSSEVADLKQQQSACVSLKTLEQKKVNAQKSASYYRCKALKLRKKIRTDSAENKQIKELKALLIEKDKQIQRLEVNNEVLEEKLKTEIEARNADGSFSDSLRLCVIELTGLEVACEKVSPVIQTVAKHLFKKEIPKSNLPSSSTVQTIVDEGHFLAKTYISDKLSTTENWGISRDGTTRKKKKILDTSVTFASGEIVSLGFSRVARETSETINSVTKDHLHELADLSNLTVKDNGNSEDFLKMSLNKLAFTMSDRANNEKKADKLLDEWRDNVLESTDESDRSKVLHFHCMAHVLLGFHRYVCNDLKEFESVLSSELGKLGRDGLSVFKFWHAKGTAVERTLRTVSEVFGPSGDHHGVRDLWEAYCSANGVKSTIGNYRDNRFNALFQTAAEVFHHKEDFIAVLLSVKNPNLKLKSVLADLQSSTIMLLVQCLGLFYLKITGPYWNLVTGNQVPYLELYNEVTELNNFLELCVKDPAVILQLNKHWAENDNFNLKEIRQNEVFKKKLCILPEGDLREILFKAVKMTAHAMEKTVKKQLADFLPGGVLHQKPSDEDLRQTSFAHLTNLGCEHHFGDLDSSQRRRPSASFHHHTSVQLLKRSGKQMMTWLQKMPDDQRCSLLQAARKGGKELRDKHRAHEQLVLTEINSLTQQQPPEKEKKRKASNDPKTNRKRVRTEPDTVIVKESDYVAVAYQDSWYPGIVIKKVDSENFVVKFMSPTHKFGYFSWPSREDIQSVNATFVLKAGFVSNCENSGRMWKISETSVIAEKYEEFSDTFF